LIVFLVVIALTYFFLAIYSPGAGLYVWAEQLPEEPDNFVELTQDQLENYPYIQKAVSSPGNEIKVPHEDEDVMKNLNEFSQILLSNEIEFLKVGDNYYDIHLDRAGPLLVAIILITLLQDRGVMDYLYSKFFIKTYDTSNFLQNCIVVNVIQLLFAFSSILFTLSVPEEKRGKSIIPFRISVFTFFMSVIFSVVTVLLKQNYAAFISSVQNSSFTIYTYSGFS
jgi:hypothetical protein